MRVVPELQEDCASMIQGYETMLYEAEQMKLSLQQKAAETQDRARAMRERGREKQAQMRQQSEAMRGDAGARSNARREAAAAGQENLNAQMEARAAEQQGAAAENLDAMNSTLANAQNRTSGLQAPPPPPVDTTELVNDFVETLQLVMEIMYGAVLGIQNVPMLIPAVLSMVTGMLKASLAVKVLVPGSSLPGVFIIVLPLITTPIFWAVFNVIFQIVGGLDLLVGLMLLAFLPCLNTFVGTWKQVARPMNDAQIADYSITMNRISSILSLVMASSFGLFVWKVHAAHPDEVSDGVSEAAKSVVQSLLDPIKLLTMFVATFSKKFYTALVCVDYMVSTIVEDRVYEKSLLELKRPPERKGCCSRKKKVDDDETSKDVGGTKASGSAALEEPFETEESKPAKKKGLCGKKPSDDDEVDAGPQLTEEEEMLDLIKNKEVRLDDLCKLLYVGDDEEWMAKKQLGIAAVRQMRDANWQAASTPTGPQPVGMLNVTIESFNGTGAVKDAYVVLELEQKDTKGLSASQCETFMTEKVKEGTELNSEHKLLPVYDISAVKLYAHVYEAVAVGTDFFMGEAMWDTPDIVSLMGSAGMPAELQELQLTRCTQPSKVGKERFQQEKSGTIRMSVGFVFPQLALGTMQIKVASAADLLAADKGKKGEADSSDPFAIVATHQIHDGAETEQKFVTQKIMKTLEPEWNETFFFDIWDLDAVLYLDIYDSDTDADDYLGQGKLSLRDFCVDTGGMVNHSVKLTPCFPGRGLPKRATDVMNVTGTVNLELTFAEDRSRLELKSGLDAQLEELIAARGFSEQQANLFRNASDEEKMKFIRSQAGASAGTSKAAAQAKKQQPAKAVAAAAAPAASAPAAGAQGASVAARELFKRVDTDQNGVLNFDEFASWWLRRQQLAGGSSLDTQLLDTTREQWATLDSDGSGDLSCDEFETLLGQLATSDWEEAFDPATGSFYYANAKTKETRWEKPDDATAIDGFMTEHGLKPSRVKPPSLQSLKSPRKKQPSVPTPADEPELGQKKSLRPVGVAADSEEADVEVGASVRGMASAFNDGVAAGASLSELQQSKSTRELPDRNDADSGGDRPLPARQAPPSLQSLQAPLSKRAVPPRAVPARPVPARPVPPR